GAQFDAVVAPDHDPAAGRRVLHGERWRVMLHVRGIPIVLQIPFIVRMLPPFSLCLWAGEKRNREMRDKNHSQADGRFHSVSDCFAKRSLVQPSRKVLLPIELDNLKTRGQRLERVTMTIQLPAAG